MIPLDLTPKEIRKRLDDIELAIQIMMALYTRLGDPPPEEVAAMNNTLIGILERMQKRLKV